MKVEINGEKITLDSTLTIRKWQRLQKDVKTISKTPADILAFYLDKDVNVVKKYPKKPVDMMINYLTTQMQGQKDVILTKTFEFQGVRYGLEMDWGKLTWGAWQDFEILSAENIENNVHHICAILYRPIIKEKGDKYWIKEYDPVDVLERAEIFKDIPVDIWFGSASFFLRIAELYTLDIKNSLASMTKLNRLMMRGWRILPKFLRERLPLDSILHSPSQSQGKI
jgi:hypothetical protein